MLRVDRQLRTNVTVSAMETYTLSQFPEPYSTIHIALFHTVTNASTIRKRLITASTASGPEGELSRSQLDYAFLDAPLVRPFPILSPKLDNKSYQTHLSFNLAHISTTPPHSYPDCLAPHSPSFLANPANPNSQSSFRDPAHTLAQQ